MTLFRATLAALCLLALPARAEPALWRVDGPHARVYLFGTIHLLPKNAVWFGAAARKAFAESGTLWEEADIGMTDPQRAAALLAHAPDPGFDLWSVLTSADAAQFRDELRRCGLDGSVVAHVHVWMTIMMVSVCQAMEEGHGGIAAADAGPEGILLKQARADHKATEFFETADEQVAIFADEPQAVQLAQLRQSIREAKSGKDSFSAIEGAWARGDTNAIARVIADARREDPVLFGAMFTARNKRFAARILNMLHGQGVAFVAIGAGHLWGPDAVPGMLAAAGFTPVRQ